MVAVFKTTVRSHEDSQKIIRSLKEKLNSSVINFDLEDRDNILRVESTSIDTDIVKKVIMGFNYEATLIKKGNI